MSIIFNTLEKLKNDTRHKGSGQQKTRNANNVISFDRIVSSLPWLTVAGLIVVAFGAAAYYVITDLPTHASGNDNGRVLAETVQEPSEEIHPDEDSTPAHIHARTTSEIEPYGDSETLKSTPDLPTDERFASEQTGPAQGTLTAAYLPPRRQANNTPSETEPYDPDGSLPGHRSESNLPDQKKRVHPVARPSRVALTHGTTRRHSDMGSAGTSKKNSGQQGLSADNGADDRQAQQDKMHLAAVNKNARICRLVSEARQSLLSEDDSRTESLLRNMKNHNPTPGL